MTVYLSTGAFRSKSLSECLETARREGLSAVELSSGIAPVDDPGAVLRRLGDGMRFLVHNYFPPPKEAFVLNIASRDPFIGAKTDAHCLAAIALAAEFGCGFYSVHAGFAADLHPSDLGQPAAQARALRDTAIDRDDAYNVMLGRVRTMADEAASHGLDLLLENNVLAPEGVRDSDKNHLLMCSPDETLAFMTAVARPNVGLLFDVGHAKVSGTALGFDPVDFLVQAKPFIRAFHLSDNDGLRDSNQLIGPDAWFLPFLSEFGPLPAVIEAYDITPQQMQRQIALVQEAFV